ncbi:MAG TPA: SprT family zinc-dependent metalloprotease [Thermohalobaculum sp.]|nr:SprT family zinc-dependent metalloprotease [Thermohalobaculum sp.]
MPVRLRVAGRARRFTLRVDPAGAGAVLTLPPGVPAAEAEAFLGRHAGWLARALARRPPLVAIGPGARLPVAGTEAQVVLAPGPRRPPRLDGARLIVAGPGAPGPRIAAWLKLRARDALVPAARRYAGMLGREAGAVALRDTRSRWGSCSSSGRLGFSWRLAMAPPEVLDYVAAHEAAHLVEMNHAPAFWALLERLVPDYRRHRAWLRREGARLHAFRFDAQ